MWSILQRPQLTPVHVKVSIYFGLSTATDTAISSSSSTVVVAVVMMVQVVGLRVAG